MAARVKRLLLAARGAFFLLTDPATVGLTPRKSPGDRRKALLVRLDGIGDFLLWLDAVRAWRDIYPADQYALTLLAHPAWAALARETGAFDDIWTLHPRRFVWSLPYRWRTLRAIRRAGFSVVVQARYSRELFVEDAVTRASGAPERIGFDRLLGRETRLQKPISDRWYTRLVPTEAGPVMELERNAALVRGLGATGFRAQVPSLPVPDALPPDLGGKAYYVLFPGAAWAGRQWPPERFGELAELIHARTGWAGVVCGGPDEGALGEALVQGTNAPLESWAGRTSLAELAAIIASARLVVSNETGAIHMAAAVGTPSVCILGGGHFGRFLPYSAPARPGGALPLPVFTPMKCFGCDWHCIYSVPPGRPVPCITNVSVEAVWRDAQAVIEGSCAPCEEGA